MNRDDFADAIVTFASYRDHSLIDRLGYRSKSRVAQLTSETASKCDRRGELAACSTPIPASIPPERPLSPLDPTVDVVARAREAMTNRKLRRVSRQVEEAFALYLEGGEAEDSEEGRAAFRAVCKVHQAEREIALDELREHAQIHAFAWSEWYRMHCFAGGSPQNALGIVILDRETGQKAVSGDICDANAGTPPARTYVMTADEELARQERDACEDAQ